jgi:succinate dehydrogenase / fumarate reductase iron-sulfur subunit
VDLDPFFEKYRSIRPVLINPSQPPDRERVQDPEARAVFDEAVRCILCGLCTAACPVSMENEEYVGPAALLRAFRYLFDSRDLGERERIELLDNKNGIWGCQTLWKCTEVCPKEIPITRCLGKVKKKIHERKEESERHKEQG